MQTQLAEIDVLFESSWEVCHKVGGIYTVLSTKARELKKIYGDKLIFIGPDFNEDNCATTNFIERKTLLKRASTAIKLPFGITLRVGRWDIPGSPIVVLVGYQGVYTELDRIYGEIWNHFGVDSLHAYGDYDESCAFAIASAIAIGAIADHLKADPSKVIAHFDEWTTGMGLLYTKLTRPNIATVFTTHATSIGRSICGNGKPLYDYFTGYHGDQMARELNMESKHSLEKVAAHHADCFTTVSDVTARECHQLLDIMPQVVTPNGFEPGFVPSSAKLNSLRKSGRERLLKIATSLTGRKWSNDTFIVATSGRNEYRNKGIDLFIDAVDTLAKNCTEKEILAFVLVPAWVKERAADLHSIFNRESQAKPVLNFITHRLNNEETDAIFGRLQRFAYENTSANVTIIYVPCYLDGNDGIIDISYYDLLPALDLTIFPSYYEPWGYTPLESIAFGVPTVSSDKAGFGQWALSSFDKPESVGIEVIERTDSNYSHDVAIIADIIRRHAMLKSDEITKLRSAASQTAKAADWKIFIANYQKAYSEALHRRDQRLAKA